MNSVLRSSTAFLVTAIFSVTSLTTGCKSSPDAKQASQTESQAAPPNQENSTQGNATQTAALSLDDLVAPIALYPDQLLAQILTASTNPQEVLDGGNWILQNQSLKGDALTNAAKTAGFGPSMQYLMSFPQVVDNMCQEMDWTTQLGQAFQADQAGVMSAVQRRRTQAQQAGNLVSSPQMTVTTQTDNGQQYVEIKPADPKVVYVPQYNPVTIYNVQSAPAPTTIVAQPQSSGVSTEAAVGIGLLSFGVGMVLGAAISNNNNYYPYPAWGYRGVYYGGRPYYPPPYRPVYPGYHPAGGYRPPANYHWSQVNNNVNVNVNKNYYNEFNNQNRPTTLPANNRPGGNPGINNPNRPSTLPTNNRPNGNSGLNTNNRPGQGNNTYQGARPTTANQKPGSGMANALPSNQQLGNRANQPANTNRPITGNNGSAGNTANTRPTTGNPGATNRGGASPATQPANRGGDRGYANASRPSTTNAGAAASPQPQNRGGGGGGAFSGGSAKAERADSSRGRSSMGTPASGQRGGAGGAGNRKTR